MTPLFPRQVVSQVVPRQPSSALSQAQWAASEFCLAGFITLPMDDWCRLVDQVREMGMKPKPEIGLQFGAGGASGVEELKAAGRESVIA